MVNKVCIASLSLEPATTGEVLSAVAAYHEEVTMLKGRGIPPELTPTDAAMQFALNRLPPALHAMIEADRREFIAGWAALTSIEYRAKKAALAGVPTCYQCDLPESDIVHQPHRTSHSGTKFWNIGKHGFIARLTDSSPTDSETTQAGSGSAREAFCHGVNDPSRPVRLTQSNAATAPGIPQNTQSHQRSQQHGRADHAEPNDV